MKNLFLLLTLLTFSSKLYAQENGNKTTNNDKELAGLWSLVAVENTNADGTKSLPYDNEPVGLMVLDKSGTYAIQILKAIRPKVIAGDKNKATPEENAALVQGNNSHFGRYAVDKIKRTITFQVTRAFYPNWEGTVQERFYTLANNELKYIVTNTTNGGSVTAAVVWKKIEPNP